MKTLYFKTNQFVRREGNVIDFTEYRNRMQQSKPLPAAVGDEVSYHWEVDDGVWHSGETYARPARPRKEHRYNLADVLEAGAAGATLALVVTIWLQFLL